MRSLMACWSVAAHGIRSGSVLRRQCQSWSSSTPSAWLRMGARRSLYLRHPWSSGCGAADTLTKDNSRSARPKPILLPDGNFVSAAVLIRLAS